MAELATVARPYAEALFRVAKSGNMAVWSDLVSEMAQVGAHPDVKALAANPNVSDRQVADTLLAILKSSISQEAKNLVEILVENNRVSLLPEIGVQFQALKNADQGSADAEIFSAFAMSDAQIADLTAVLSKKFGRKLEADSHRRQHPDWRRARRRRR